MNGYEALAHMSKSPYNKVYRDGWIDGTKYVSMTREGKILFDDGTFADPAAGIFRTLTGKGALEEGWHIYEETYTLSQAIDKVIEGRGRVKAKHTKDREKIWWDTDFDELRFSFDVLFNDELVGWTLETVSVDDAPPF